MSAEPRNYSPGSRFAMSIRIPRNGDPWNEKLLNEIEAHAKAWQERERDRKGGPHLRFEDYEPEEDA